jgi:hypothetical protein
MATQIYFIIDKKIYSSTFETHPIEHKNIVHAIKMIHSQKNSCTTLFAKGMDRKKENYNPSL